MTTDFDASPAAARETSVVEQHDDAGVLLLRSTMAGGVLHGPLEQYGPDGQPAMTAHFIDGKLHGAVALFGDDGVVVQRSAFQHGLAQTIAIPRRARVMVGLAIALDAQQIAARMLGIGNTQVDKKTGNADLWMDLVPAGFDCIGYLHFKRTVIFAPRYARQSQPARTREVQEQLESYDPPSFGTFKIDIFIGN